MATLHRVSLEPAKLRNHSCDARIFHHTWYRGHHWGSIIREMKKAKIIYIASTAMLDILTVRLYPRLMWRQTSNPTTP